MGDSRVSKEICEEKHDNIKYNLAGLKANIHTSKESLSNRLDKVNDALIGDTSKPGGLLRDIIELGKDIKGHKESIKKDIATQNFKMKLCLIMCFLVIGGKFLGTNLMSIKDYFFPSITTTISTPASKEKDVPIEIQEYIKKQLELYKTSPVEDTE